jgi:hypothetical protein
VSDPRRRPIASWTAIEEWHDELEGDLDVCHHGVGFDEDCWRCEMEIAADIEEERA